jgi:hypothetical protein
MKLFSLKGAALVLITATAITSTTACAKEVDRSIAEAHAHLYQNKAGYIRYIDEEYTKYKGYERKDDYILINGQEELYEVMKEHNLMRIDDNLELIQKQQEENKDYFEYRYKYTYMNGIPQFRTNGKTTSVYYVYYPVTRYSWTTDENHSRLTGEMRLCHYTYTGYKIVEENGKLVVKSSQPVDDITSIMDEYPFVKKSYYKLVNIDGSELDYEDGPEENMTKEEQKRVAEYERKNNQDSSKTK